MSRPCIERPSDHRTHGPQINDDRDLGGVERRPATGFLSGYNQLRTTKLGILEKESKISLEFESEQ